MWPMPRVVSAEPDIEKVRRHARILVIDDQAFPAQRNFTRDGYHLERWPSIKNLSQLTDGDWDVILLDIQGVGLVESPALQGLGILKHIKKSNPAQAVIIYSAKPQAVSSTEYLVLADAVFDKGMSYLEYKEKVDELLLRHATPGYFIAAMNRELGESAALVPRAVPKALRAFRAGNTDGLRRYLGASLTDQEKVETLVHVITIGVRVVSAVSS
jgi:DNA-binding response OmpR family regulator